MSLYLWIKTLHILSAAVLFGTGMGIAYFKWTVDRSGHVGAMRIMSEKVVMADWVFTSVAAIVQPITGIFLALTIGYPLFKGWIAYALLLYVLIGLYWRYCRTWFWLGVPGFSFLVMIFWLMVFKPN